MRTWMMLSLLVLPSWASDSQDLNEAIELPARAERLRKAGVEAGQVREALQAAKDADLPADDAEDILENEEEAVKEHGPVDNFGAFVQERLREGKRGKELAEAIRKEHQERGKGKGKGKGPDGEKGHGHDKDKGADKGHGGDKDKGKDKDKGAGKGKGGDKGADGDKGKGKGGGKKGKGKNK